MSRHRPHRSAGRGIAAVRRRLAALLTVSVALVVAWPASATATVPTPGDHPVAGSPAIPGPTKPGYSTLVNHSAVLQPALENGSTRRTVFVQLADQGVAQVSAALLARGEPAAVVRLAVVRARTAIGAQAAAVAATAKAADPAAVTVFQVANAIPGVGITASPAALRALAVLPDVARISEIVPKTRAAVGSAQLDSAMRSWTDRGVTGLGVRVGVIDSGIDYTAANFGGPGTTAAHEAAGRTNRWEPTAKVAGGLDFVGDNYDAAAETSSGVPNPGYQPVPHPDANPLDCSGHGSTVGGAIAGRGVDAAGQAFGGRYPTLTGPALDQLTVAPGVAPQALLYALKVFGCSGATDAIIPALDWALDPNGDDDFSDHLDVVDLSLTGPANASDDPENAVLDAVAQLGVLPVTTNPWPAADGSASGSSRALSAASGSAELAGVAALVRQARPSWTPEQVKAAVINSAGAGSGVAATDTDPGAGSIDATSAVSTSLLAYSATNPGAVSVSFGVVQADVRQQVVVQTSAVVVQNVGGDDANLALTYRQAVGQPGVSYQVSPDHMVLPSGTSALATVVMTINPAALRHTLAPGVAAQQTNALTGLDEARQYQSASSGAVLITGASAVALDVPVRGSARPFSTTAAVDGTFTGSPALVLSGTRLGALVARRSGQHRVQLAGLSAESGLPQYPDAGLFRLVATTPPRAPHRARSAPVRRPYPGQRHRFEPTVRPVGISPGTCRQWGPDGPRRPAARPVTCGSGCPPTPTGRRWVTGCFRRSTSTPTGTTRPTTRSRSRPPAVIRTCSTPCSSTTRARDRWSTSTRSTSTWATSTPMCSTRTCC